MRGSGFGKGIEFSDLLVIEDGDFFKIELGIVVMVLSEGGEDLVFEIGKFRPFLFGGDHN